MNKSFKLGKFYRHSGGGMMKIVGLAETVLYGSALIAEEPEGYFKPVGRDESNAVNWEEISEQEFMKNYS